MRVFIAILILAGTVLWLWLAFADADMGSVKEMIERYAGP